MASICKMTRASAARLATAQRHAAKASRLTRDADSILRIAPLNTANRHAAATLREEARRLQALSDAAMSRHGSIRRLLD